MDSGGLSGLASIRRRVETATVQFEALTQGVDHPLVVGSRFRLQAADETMTRAAGGLSVSTQLSVGTPVVVLVTWAMATLAGLAGLSGGWTITVTAVAVALVSWPMSRLHKAVGRRLGRRRTTLPAAPSRSSPSPIRFQGGGRGELEQAAAVQTQLGLARAGLAGVIRRRLPATRYGSLAQTKVGFDWLRRNDYPLLLLFLADRRLCQVSQAIDLWLATTGDEP
jgi:hypothetical protein